MTTAALSTPLAIGPVELSSRIVVAPMYQYSDENSRTTDWHRMHMLQHEISSVRLFMLEATGVTADDRVTPFCLALDRDDQEVALRDLVVTCRCYGAAKLGI
jgi:2,4-dienoyl-CoA reductase-like NADH-dependent reductase (Old Yellow Enzyme family)